MIKLKSSLQGVSSYKFTGKSRAANGKGRGLNSSSGLRFSGAFSNPESKDSDFEKTIIWTKAARVAYYSLDMRDASKIVRKLKQFKNGASKDPQKVYAMRLDPKYRLIFQQTTQGFEILDIVNRLNYDPKKVVELAK